MRTDYSEGGMRWSFLLLAAAAQLLGSDAFSGNLIGAAGTRRLHPAWSRVSFQKQSRPSMQLQSPGDRKDRKQGVASREFSPILSMILAAGLLFPSAASAAPDWDVETTRTYLDIFLAIFSTLFFIRIPITWYPQLDITKFPQAIVCW